MIKEIIETETEPWKTLLELESTGILIKEFPELCALDYSKGLHKNNFYHTLQVLKNICQGRYGNSSVLRWAAVLHDIGKPKTAKETKDGHWTFHNHNVVGSVMVSKIMMTQGVKDQEIIDEVKNLVYLHMRPVSLAQEPVTDSAVRRVMTEAGNLLEPLMELAEADITSRNRAIFIKNIREVRAEMERIKNHDYWESIRPVCNGTWLISRFPEITGDQINYIKDELKKCISQGCPNTISDLGPIADSLYGKFNS